MSVIEFIEQYKWFGLSSTVSSCLFLTCATAVAYIFILRFMSRPSSVKSSIVLC